MRGTLIRLKEMLERASKGSTSFSKLFSQESDTNEISMCGSCHALLEPEDKYCRYCGTEKGKAISLLLKT